MRFWWWIFAFVACLALLRLGLTHRDLVARGANETAWRLFRTSLAYPSIVAGPDGKLYEESYLKVYCGLRPKFDPDVVQAFAWRVRAIQEWLKSRRQPFVLLLAPMKPFFTQNSLPVGYPCDGPDRDHFYREAVRAYTIAGVNFIDGRQELTRAGPNVYFPKNGIHWNWRGASVLTEALLANLRGQGLEVPPFRYTLTPTPNETGSDRDLADLLHLLVPPKGPPSVDVAVQSDNPGGEKRLVAISDSFFFFNARLLSQAQVFRAVDVYGYVTVEQWRYVDGIPRRLRQSTEEVVDSLLDADAVVFEVVESNAIASLHVLRAVDLLDKRAREGLSSEP